MLNQNINDVDVSMNAESDSTFVQKSQPQAVASVGTFHSAFSGLKNRFKTDMDFYVLPADATTGCTILNGGIKFGDKMQHDAGDFLIINPLNITEYQKVKLGAQNPSEEEKRLQVNCYDGETVIFGEETCTKAQYMDKLAQMGYSKAGWDTRAVLHGMYLDCDRASKVKIAEDDKLFSIYLSPSSYRAWNSFLLKAAIGQSTAHQLRLTKADRSWNGVNWVQFGFERVDYQAKAAA